MPNSFSRKAPIWRVLRGRLAVTKAFSAVSCATKESRPAHRPQSGSAPQARPRETTHATAVPCRRRGIKPSPPLRSLSHHPTKAARLPAALTDALLTHPAPGRSSQLDPLAKETLPESCIEQNPPAIVTQAIFRLLNESGYIYAKCERLHTPMSTLDLDLRQC